ncbi:hypothetical protein K456DRAFT_1430273 [Colletotrichum gloeosporioides 23]|nr:hypothetical protein K456DRAFT_1430273 [Colletotrichum gloeosporioides 23]
MRHEVKGRKEEKGDMRLSGLLLLFFVAQTRRLDLLFLGVVVYAGPRVARTRGDVCLKEMNDDGRYKERRFPKGELRARMLSSN